MPSKFLMLSPDGTRIALSVQLAYGMPTIDPFTNEKGNWIEGWPDRGRLSDCSLCYHCGVCSENNTCMIATNKANPIYCVTDGRTAKWLKGL